MDWREAKHVTSKVLKIDWMPLFQYLNRRIALCAVITDWITGTDVKSVMFDGETTISSGLLG